VALLKAEREVMSFAQQISLEKVAGLSITWPEDWSGGPFSVTAKSTTLVRVQRDTEEWKRVENEWMRGSNAFSAELLQVERVQNVLAWQAYYGRVQVLASRNPFPFPPGTSVFHKANEQWMKHGTRNTNPEVIYSGEQGLDCRYCGKGLYGIAAYTAEDAKYSHDYSFTYDSNEKKSQMFLVRVAAGKVHEVAVRSEEHAKLITPPSGFDSVRGCVRSPNFMAIMVYQPDSAYPAYLLTYRCLEKK